MFYAKSTGGFYSEEIHGSRKVTVVAPDWQSDDPDAIPDTIEIDNPACKIPADAVEITPEEHAALLDGEASGKRIVAAADGRPLLQDPPPPTLDELKGAKNTEINLARAAANTGVFPHDGKLFSCDALSRSDIDGMNGYVALYDELPPDFPGVWKAADNSYYPIADVAAWKSFYAAMVATGTANFAHSQQLKAQLAEATTAKAVAAIVW